MCSGNETRRREVAIRHDRRPKQADQYTCGVRDAMRTEKTMAVVFAVRGVDTELIYTKSSEKGRQRKKTW